MTTLTEARAAVRDIRREVRDARASLRDGESDLFDAYDCSAVKPPPRTMNPATGKARRDYSGGEWDWMRGRPDWHRRVLVGGPGAVYGPDELLDVLYEAGILSAGDDLDTWADRVLSARQARKLTPQDAADLTGYQPALLALVLDGDLDDAARAYIGWADDMSGDLRAQYDALRALQARVAAEVERFAAKVRHERYDVGRSWAEIARALEVTRPRALRIAHPQGKPRDDTVRRPHAGSEVRDSTVSPAPDFSEVF